MRSLAPLVALLSAPLFAACGPFDPDAAAPATPSASASAPPPTASASAPAPSASAEAAPAPAEPPPPDAAQRAAEALLLQIWSDDPKAPPIGWLPDRQAFLFAETYDEEGGDGIGLSVVLASEDPKVKRQLDVCTPGECERDPTSARDKLAAWLREEQLGDAMLLEPTLFPDDPKAKPEVDVGAVPAKLAWKKDHLELTRKGKPPQKLAPLRPTPPHVPKPDVVVASPDGTKLAVVYLLDPGPKFSEGFNLLTQTIVYAVPK